MGVAAVGGVNVKWNKDTNWPAGKADTPFGQLPVLAGPNDFKMGQSLAIARFLARKGQIQGSTDVEFAMSEQLIQEADDLIGLLGKAHFGGNRTEAMDQLFTTGLKPHLDALTNLLKGETFTGKLLTGDIAIFAAFDILNDLQTDFLDAYPSLKAFYGVVGSNEKIKTL